MTAIQEVLDMTGTAVTHLVRMLTYPYPHGIVARLAGEVVARVG